MVWGTISLECVFPEEPDSYATDTRPGRRHAVVSGAKATISYVAWTGNTWLCQSRRSPIVARLRFCQQTHFGAFIATSTGTIQYNGKRDQVVCLVRWLIRNQNKKCNTIQSTIIKWTHGQVRSSVRRLGNSNQNKNSILQYSEMGHVANRHGQLQAEWEKDAGFIYTNFRAAQTSKRKSPLFYYYLKKKVTRQASWPWTNTSATARRHAWQSGSFWGIHFKAAEATPLTDCQFKSSIVARTLTS